MSVQASAIAITNSVRAATRGVTTGRARDRVAATIALSSVALFAVGESVAFMAARRATALAVVALPTLRPAYLLETLVRGGAFAMGVLLVLGSMTSAVSMLFLSEELTVRITLPLAHRGLLLRQMLLTIGAASLPSLLLTLPLLVVGEAPRGPLGFGTGLLALLSIVLLAGTAGCALALLLVKFIPPRRARLLAAFLSAAGLAVALVGFRTARPERLLDPVAALSLLRAIGETPPRAPGLDPIGWAVRAYMLGHDGDPRGLGIAAGLLLSGVALVVLTARALSNAHLLVWRSTRENGQDEELSGRASRPATSLGGMLVRAETMTLFREASTPAQLGSLMAVFVLDLMNVRLLPAADPSARDVVAGLQTGLSLFLVSALSLRFAYPSVSSDGRSALVLRTLPLSPVRHLAARLVVRVVPSVVAALLLVVASDLVLRPASATVAASLVVALVGSLSLPALHLGLGALFPRYDAPNAVAVALGAGGLFALTLSTALSAVAALAVSDELRQLCGALIGFRVSRIPMEVAWCASALALGLVPLVLAARSLEASDLSAG
jgi:ABC-2 type transport system permease protein